MANDLEPVADLAAVAPQRTLQELANEANREHDLAQGVLTTWVEHAARIGAILNQAREQVPRGQWHAFTREYLHFGESSCQIYSKVAQHIDFLRLNGATTMTATTQLLSQLPSRWRPGRPDGVKNKDFHPNRPALDELKRLRSQGLSYGAIASKFGVSRNSVRRWIDPDFARWEQQRDYEKERQRRAQTTARKKAQLVGERVLLSKQAVARNDPLGHALEHLRKLLQYLDKAMSDGPAEQRPEVRRAMACTHQAEDNIVAALRGKTLETYRPHPPYMEIP